MNDYFFVERFDSGFWLEFNLKIIAGVLSTCFGFTFWVRIPEYGRSYHITTNLNPDPSAEWELIWPWFKIKSLCGFGKDWVKHSNGRI